MLCEPWTSWIWISWFLRWAILFNLSLTSIGWPGQLGASESHPTVGTKGASQRVAQMLLLRSVVKSIPTVREAVAMSTSRLLELVCDVCCIQPIRDQIACIMTQSVQMLSDSRIMKIETLIGGGLNEDATAQKVRSIVRLPIYSMHSHIIREADSMQSMLVFMLSRSISLVWRRDGEIIDLF